MFTPIVISLKISDCNLGFAFYRCPVWPLLCSRVCFKQCYVRRTLFDRPIASALLVQRANLTATARALASFDNINWYIMWVNLPNNMIESISIFVNSFYREIFPLRLFGSDICLTFYITVEWPLWILKST